MQTDAQQICRACGKAEAVTACDHCGRMLCRQCRQLELWGTGAEDLSVRHFCPACKDNPDINPWGARPQELGLGEVPDIVNKADELRANKAA